MRVAACGNSTIPAWSSVTRSLLLFLPTPLSLSRGPPTDRPVSLWLVVFFTPSFSVLSCHSIFLSFSSIPFPSTFYLWLFLSSLCSPPSIFPSPPPVSSHPGLSLSLILLCGGFAVGSPRHEWSISRSPGGSGPYNSVQWAWIVSQSTQENLSVNIVIFVGCILTVRVFWAWLGTNKKILWVATDFLPKWFFFFFFNNCNPNFNIRSWTHQYLNLPWIHLVAYNCPFHHGINVGQSSWPCFDNYSKIRPPTHKRVQSTSGLHVCD